MLAQLGHVLEKARLKDPNEKTDAYGFSQDFYNFLGIGNKGSDYKWSMSQYAGAQYNKLRTDLVEDAAPNFYTPLDDFYASSGDGGDLAFDFGRVPVSHLMTLADQRLGIVFRACNGVANDVFRNKFSFVEYAKPEKEIMNPQIETIFKWMRRTCFWDNAVWWLDFEARCGQGNLVAYWDSEAGKEFMHMKDPAPKKRPDSFQAFSSYHLTPINIHESTTKLDFDKRKWKFIGGMMRPTTIHETRIYPLETRRVEFGLRGRALAELAWVPLMCYLNTSYYILKSLSQLGTVVAGINVDMEFPTPNIVSAYIDVWNQMAANQCYILGRNAKLNIQNAASKFGTGIREYLEFLIEDISAAWIFPKNQLLGRSEAGGLQGAGALISKEDYLASNIAAKQLQLTNDLMYIFQDVCHFPNLENKTLRFNIDLHKTEEQRMNEDILREQVEVAQLGTKQAKLGFKLYKRQVELQMEMSKVQLEMLKKNPEKLLEFSDKDEENLSEKDQTQKDFIDKREIVLKRYFIALQKEYKNNQNLLDANERSVNQLYKNFEANKKFRKS